MKKWMKQCSRILVLILAVVCLVACFRLTAKAARSGNQWWGGTWKGSGTQQWYDAGSDGYPSGGWHQVWSDSEGKYYWYYFDSKGYAAINSWVPAVNGATDKTAYVDENCRKVVSNWKTIDGATYYFGSDGIYDTGWQQIGGVWYYLGPDGKRVTGWSTQASDTYYLNPSSNPPGAMVTGWKTIYYNGANRDYYFNSSGIMQKNTTVDGYYLGSDGAKANGWVGTTYYSGGLAKTQTLTIKNSVTGQTGKSFSITVKYTRNTTTTTETISLANGGSKTYTLPYNTTFTVTQGSYSGYSTSISKGSGTLTSNTTVTVTNTQQYQTLTVKNVISGANTTFSYSVTSKYADNGAHATQTFTLSNGQSKALSLPKNGTYTVTQTAISGYTTTISGTSSGTLSANTTVTFTNTQQLTLTIKNQVTGQTTKSFSIVVTYTKPGASAVTETLSLANNGSKRYTLPYNTKYTVTQVAYSGYTTAGTVTSAATLTGNATVTVTNTLQYRTLTVTNAVSGADTAFSYSLTAKYADGSAYSTQTFTLSNGGSTSFTLPASGTYTVTQTAINGYTTEKTDSGNGTLSANATVAFVNTQQLSLTVVNQVSGDNAEAGKPFAITVTYTKPGKNAESESFQLQNGGTKTITLPYGTTYTVIEVDYSSEGYTTTGVVTEAKTLTVNATETLVNVQQNQTLTVCNTVNGSDEVEGAEYTFTLNVQYASGTAFITDQTFTLRNGETASFTLPRNAAYSVAITPVADLYSAVTDSGNGNLTADALVEFFNAEMMGLTVVNRVSGENVEDGKTFAISVTYTQPGAETITETVWLADGGEQAYTLPYGTTYKVEADYSSEGYTTTGTVTAEETLTEEITITIINTQENGTLTVNAVVYTAAAESTAAFDANATPLAEIVFNITLNVQYANGTPFLEDHTFTLVDGQSTSFSLPKNATYTITAETVSGFFAYMEDTGNGTLSENATVTFYNAQLLDLTVEHQIVGETVEADKSFNISVDCTLPDGTLVNNTLSFTQEHSQEICELPYGTTYTVKAEEYPDYSVSGIVTEQATLTADAAVTVVHTAKEYCLIVENTVFGDAAAKETDFSFTLSVLRSDGTTAYVPAFYTLNDGGSKEFKDNTFTLRNGQSATFILPAGCRYEVEQAKPGDAYAEQEVSENASVLLMSQNETVTFTNRKWITLTLGTSVATDEAGNLGSSDYVFSFTVTLSAQAKDNDTGVQNGDDYVYSAELIHGQSVAFAVPAGTECVISQASACAVDGYRTAFKINGADRTEGYEYSGMPEVDTEIVYENIKIVAVPTGVNLTVLPFLGMVVFGVALAAMQTLSVSGRSRRRR